MIRDKVKYTEQEREELAKLRKQSGAVDKEMYKALKADDMTTANAKEKELEALSARSFAIKKAAEGRYIESLGGDLEKILAECSDIARVFTKKDFDKYRRPFVKLEEDKRKNGEEIGEGLAALLEKYSDTPEGAARYLFQCFRVQLDALAALDGIGGATEEEAAEKFKAHREHTDRARAIARTRARELYSDIVLMTGTPARHIELNHPVVNHMQSKGWISGQQFEVEWTGSRNALNTTSAYIVNKKDALKNLFHNLKEDERQIYGAVVSLGLEADRRGIPFPIAIDLNTIYKAMPGRGAVLSDARRQELKTFLDACRHTDMIIDNTEELRAKKLIPEDEDSILKGAMLEARWGKKNKGGDTVETLYLLQLPILCEVSFPSEEKNYIISYPSFITEIHDIEKDANGKIIQLPGVKPETKQLSNMTTYILRRIYVMKNDLKRSREKLKNHNKYRKRAITDGKDPDLYSIKALADFQKQSPIILYDSIFKNAGISATSYKEKGRYRKVITDILDNQIAYNIIKAWTYYPNDTRPKGVKIELNQ